VLENEEFCRDFNELCKFPKQFIQDLRDMLRDYIDTRIELDRTMRADEEAKRKLEAENASMVEKEEENGDVEELEMQQQCENKDNDIGKIVDEEEMVDEVNNNNSANNGVIRWKNQAVVSESQQKIRVKLETQMRAMAEQPFLRGLVLQAQKDLIPKPDDVKREKHEDMENYEGYDCDFEDWEDWGSDDE